MYIGLTVTGPTDEISQFQETVRGRDENGKEVTIDFTRVIPIPEEVRNPFSAQIHIDDHHVTYSPSWCGRNWGAFSNALFAEVLEDSAGTFWVQFDTVGDFPDLVIEKLVELFPQLTFDGSAFENVEKFYMTFEGRNGQFTVQEGNYTEAFGEEDHDEDDESYSSEIWVASS